MIPNMSAAKVRLECVTPPNFKDCVQLQVATAQRKHVLPVLDCLARAYVYREIATAFAVYRGETVVGFMLLRHSADSDNCFLWQFLIDERYQGQGLGRQAMERVMEWAQANPSFRSMTLTYDEDNQAAASLYRSLGFTDLSAEAGEVNLILKW